jgi:hypothetical protein
MDLVISKVLITLKRKNKNKITIEEFDQQVNQLGYIFRNEFTDRDPDKTWR